MVGMERIWDRGFAGEWKSCGNGYCVLFIRSGIEKKLSIRLNRVMGLGQLVVVKRSAGYPQCVEDCPCHDSTHLLVAILLHSHMHQAPSSTVNDGSQRIPWTSNILVR